MVAKLDASTGVGAASNVAYGREDVAIRLLRTVTTCTPSETSSDAVRVVHHCV